MSARPTLLLLTLSCFCSCVAYERDEANVQSIAAEIETRRGGTFTVDEAIDLALQQNPQLLALAAQLRAASAETTVPLPIRANWLGRMEAVEAIVDPVALLGLGSRGAEIDRADARVVEAAAMLAEQRWRTIGAVVTGYRIHRELDGLEVPELDVDVSAFEKAGLASPVAAMQVRAAHARAASERIELERARRDNLARLRALLGLPEHAELVVKGIPSTWLTQPRGTAGELIRRPDLAVAAARFEVADAQFHKAVADQYPSLRIGPNVSLVGNPLRAMAALQIPIGMHGLAEAARERRAARRAELAAAFLQAQQQATLSDQELRATEAAATATAAALASSRTEFDAARAGIEVEIAAFAELGHTSTKVMRNTMEHRRAVLARVRAEVQRATAYGWPRQPANPTTEQTP